MRNEKLDEKNAGIKRGHFFASITVKVLQVKVCGRTAKEEGALW